ncbi:MAG: LapA family protein [Cyanobacteria bacterium P01_G01_bin.39]
MSRIKLLLLILIVAVLSVVFWQNREPIALKFLCGDEGSSFCPQSVPLPLAVWMGLFILIGAIISMLLRTLNAYGYRNSTRKQVILDDELYPEEKNWQSRSKGQNKTTKLGNPQDTMDQGQFAETSSYEVPQKPQNIERSGSTYSYKYREAGERQNHNHESSRKTPREPSRDTNNPQDDEEDWI